MISQQSELDPILETGEEQTPANTRKFGGTLFPPAVQKNRSEMSQISFGKKSKFKKSILKKELEEEVDEEESKSLSVKDELYETSSSNMKPQKSI